MGVPKPQHEGTPPPMSLKALTFKPQLYAAEPPQRPQDRCPKNLQAPRKASSPNPAPRVSRTYGNRDKSACGNKRAQEPTPVHQSDHSHGSHIPRTKVRQGAKFPRLRPPPSIVASCRQQPVASALQARPGKCCRPPI